MSPIVKAVKKQLVHLLTKLTGTWIGSPDRG